MKKILLISKCNIEGKSSGCLHLKDIYNCLNKKNELSFIELKENLIKEKIDHLYTIDHRNSINTNTQNDGEIEKIIYKNNEERNYYTINIIESLDRANFESNIDYYLSKNIINYLSIKLSKQIIDFCFREHINDVIIYIEHDMTYFLAEKLCECDINVTPIIMDPLDNLFYFYNYDKPSKILLRKVFENICIKSKNIIVCSNDAVEIIRAYGGKNILKALPIFRSKKNIEYITKFKDKIDLLKVKKISIAICGQIYADETLEIFFKTLSTIYNEMNIKFYIHYFGSDTNLVSHYKTKFKNLNINFIETIDHNIMVSKIQKLDLGYVPYPFRKEFRNTVNFSFPSKFVSYLEANLIPIYHGPNNSTVDNLLTEHNLKLLSINSMNITTIRKNLLNIINELYNLEELHKNLDKMSNCFKEKILEKNLNNIVS